MAVYDQEPIYVGNTTDIYLDRFKKKTSTTYENAATVVFTIRDAAGDVVSGLQNVAMTYVTGSRGRYLGVVPSTADIVDGAVYTVRIVATKAGQGIGDWTQLRVGTVR